MGVRQGGFQGDVPRLVRVNTPALVFDTLFVRFWLHLGCQDDHCAIAHFHVLLLCVLASSVVQNVCFAKVDSVWGLEFWFCENIIIPKYTYAYDQWNFMFSHYPYTS